MEISKIQSTYPNAIWFDSAHTGTESGSFSEPYNTLGEASANTPSGGVIAVKAGTHVVGTLSGLNSNRTIVGTGSDAIMSASSVIALTSGSTLIDLNIVSTGTLELFRMETGGSMSIEGCIFSNTNPNCVGIFSGYNLSSGNNLTVSSTTFKLQTNPTFFSNPGARTGAVIKAWNYGWIMDTTFTSCAFILTGGTATNFFGYKRPTATSTFKNCIFKGYSGSETLYDTISGWSSGIIVDTHNCYHNTGHSGGTNNLFSDPLFVDIPNDDFRLRPSSPCIGAGTLN